MIRILLTTVALLAAVPAHADGPLPKRDAAAERAAFEADRADILAMAGTFKVKFDMQETTPWRTDYTPIPAKVSGGNEVVRVIEDTGRKISLQHILVIDTGGKTMLVKHWRQDWEYEPARVLVYAGPDTWKWEAVPERMRAGRWSQTVYQVDDSPRYGGWGQWTTEGGLRRWRSNWTWRPLARRDAVRSPVYDRYLSINRHQKSPTGWVHWQDNIKMGEFAGELEPVVQESVLNTYTTYDAYDVKAADTYWAATKGFWAAVRAAWASVAETKNGIHVMEEADHGSSTANALLKLADAVQAGTATEADAIAKGRRIIDDATKPVA
ncbi:DUF6607 family protein [Sphingomonas floccifaciens]|uniref:DUF6607 family protein n=1 Tax=Sphingomonas floccifaciens TaxID=1844115 RepID=A0ABW4NJ00_9SPHN